MSELSRVTDLPVATLKFYLREGLLHSGDVTSRTQATYDESHAERVRLIRALIESAHLSLARVRQVLETLDEPPSQRYDLLAAAQSAITPACPAAPDPAWTAVARQFVADRGWPMTDDDPLVELLGEQIRVLVASGIESQGQATLEEYADAAEHLAVTDLATVPADAAQAVRQVVIGTLLTDPLILTFRRLAQRHITSGGTPRRP
ncbi:MerR family transcriptional regulator [Rudaeicoccus suwonensis]|uniref:MerR-like DNA binding protein n=1 Tax=Rudaeicoccus suwonensis TaxID=657409 RepID=A0A561E9B9_9MICO|nr:MerR family transcriptional regulator [Rudaeicoccus suwonensis]TWE12213.1 MerR-like DNA binding protein [Rudaeicoccus suwonensis]